MATEHAPVSPLEEIRIGAWEISHTNTIVPSFARCAPVYAYEERCEAL